MTRGQARGLRLIAACLMAGGLAGAVMTAPESSAEDAFALALGKVRESLDARLYSETAAGARQLLTEAEARSGPDSAEAAGALELLVKALWMGGSAGEEETLALAERWALIEESLNGPDHPRLADALNSLAYVIRTQQGDSPSLPVFERALAIREKALGPDHSEVGKSLSNLAFVHSFRGDYDAAARLLERSVRILELTLGADNPRIAPALVGQANVAKRLGNYEGAKQILERTLRMQEVLGPDNDQECGTRYALGNLLFEMGDYDGARFQLERWLSIERKLKRTENFGHGIGLADLAAVLNEMGETIHARSLIEQALALLQKKDDPENLSIISARQVHAEILANLGDIAASKRTYEQFLPVLEKVKGAEHPVLARALFGYARLQWAQGEVIPALETALRAESIARAHFRRTAHGLTEREALRYEKVRTSGRDVALSVLQTTPSDRRSAPLVGEVWDHFIQSRALVLDEIASRHHSAIRDESPELALLREDLVRAKNRLARSVFSRDPSERFEAYRERLLQSVSEEELAERAIALRSRSDRDRLEARRFGLAEVRDALPAGSALVAFVQYDRLPRSSRRVEPVLSPASTTRSYMAFVQRSGRSDPEAFFLGTAGEIDALAAAWKKAAQTPARGVLAADDSAEQSYRASTARLREAIWDPISRSLEGASLVFVVPDGMIHLVSLATLPTRDGKYLVETAPTLHYLSAERDLVRHARRPPPAGRGLLALGGPDFDARPADLRPATGSITSSFNGPAVTGGISRAISYRGPTARCETFRTLRFEPLQDAGREASDVRSIWPESSPEDLMLLTGPHASEAAFKRSAPSRRVLHLATHGFFVQDDCRPDSATPAVAGDNPLLLTGLALAGANRRQEAGPGSDDEDGILTAEEVASLDLSGVEWAVLSACETGAGTVRAGEGVLGLRRAFEVAGAETLIMSLWAVEDGATREWMRRLYQARQQGVSTAEAVRRADTAEIEMQRSKGRSTHPFYWGAFVSAGNWR